jgi:hypothetical protein
MIKRTIGYSALCLFLVTIACNNPTTKEEIQEDTVPEKVVEKLDFEGKVTTDRARESIIQIDIYKKGESTIFQTLGGLELPYQVDNPFFDTPTFEDLNFDGIPDLRMPESVGNANVYYAYWIYNPTTKQFEQNTEMTLSLPKVDVSKKQIMSFERNLAASYIETTYAYQNEKFVVTRIESKDYIDENKYQSVVEERQVDGTMKEVRNELVEEEEG